MTGPQNPASWQYRALNELNPGLDYLSEGLCDLVDAGHPVVAGTADLQYSNGLVAFARRHPDRFLQFGIEHPRALCAARQQQHDTERKAETHQLHNRSRRLRRYHLQVELPVRLAAVAHAHAHHLPLIRAVELDLNHVHDACEPRDFHFSQTNRTEAGHMKYVPPA